MTAVNQLMNTLRAGAVALLLSAGVSAQTLENLHHFSSAEGRGLVKTIVLADRTLYGTSDGGDGSVFAMNTDGTGFTNLYSFPPRSGAPYYTNSEGCRPEGPLLLLGESLYGTAAMGGSGYGHGTVFALKTNGTGYTVLHRFAGGPEDGSTPFSGLVLWGGRLFGTTVGGGRSECGTVFSLETNGTGFAILHHFSGYGDGKFPGVARLVVSGNRLYGSANDGGSAGVGTVFALNTDGSGFATLHNFSVPDGTHPVRGVVLSGDTLYGTACRDGAYTNGTIFAIGTNGTGFRVLHAFAPTTSTNSPLRNSEGAFPWGDLTLSGEVLYGVATDGGTPGYGTVFALSTAGTDFRVLHTFAGSPAEGALPRVGPVLCDNSLYGATGSGGSADCGTVFRLALHRPPPLSMTRYGPDVVLTWPTNADTFRLQSTTKLTAPATWVTHGPPVIANGQNTVTNGISGVQRLYRLVWVGCGPWTNGGTRTRE